MATKAATARVAPAPKQAPQRRTAPLRVVQPQEGTRSVGALGTVAVLFLFATLLGLAGLHAVLVQNQAALDALLAQNQARQEQVDQLLADVAHLDSPEGVAEQVAGNGLVAANDVVTLAAIGPGTLAAPLSDPFGLAAVAAESVTTFVVDAGNDAVTDAGVDIGADAAEAPE